MSLKSLAAKIFAKKVFLETQKWANNPIETQQKVFENLLNSAKNTVFGKDHDFENITTFQEFAKNVPVRDYEDLKHYIDQVVQGKENILWNEYGFCCI